MRFKDKVVLITGASKGFGRAMAEGFSEAGAKVIVCKLKSNPLGYTSIAYPVDELRIPEWFKELPFDGDAMEATILDQKLDNLIGVLGWDIQSTETTNTFNKLFEF